MTDDDRQHQRAAGAAPAPGRRAALGGRLRRLRRCVVAAAVGGLRPLRRPGRDPRRQRLQPAHHSASVERAHDDGDEHDVFGDSSETPVAPAGGTHAS